MSDAYSQTILLVLSPHLISTTLPASLLSHQGSALPSLGTWLITLTIRSTRRSNASMTSVTRGRLGVILGSSASIWKPRHCHGDSILAYACFVTSWIRPCLASVVLANTIKIHSAPTSWKLFERHPLITSINLQSLFNRGRIAIKFVVYGGFEGSFFTTTGKHCGVVKNLSVFFL